MIFYLGSIQVSFIFFFILKNTGSLFVGITESCKFLFKDV